MRAPYCTPPSLATGLCIYRIFYPGSSKSSVTGWQVQLSLFYGRRSPVEEGKMPGPAEAPGTGVDPSRDGLSQAGSRG